MAFTSLNVRHWEKQISDHFLSANGHLENWKLFILWSSVSYAGFIALESRLGKG